MDNNELYTVKMKLGLNSLLRSLSLSLSLTVRDSTLEQLTEELYDQNYRHEDLRDGLNGYLIEAKDIHDRTGKQPMKMPSATELKKHIEKAIVKKRQIEKEEQNIRKQEEAQKRLDTSARALDRAVRKFGFIEIKNFYLEWRSSTMGSISASMKSDFQNKEELSKAIGIDACMMDLIETGGDFDKAIRKIESESMEKGA